MKKFLLMLLVVLALPTFAQNYQFRISSFMSEDAMETISYGYETADGTDLRAIHEVDFLSDPTMDIIDSLHYDAEGRIIQVASHQLLDGEYVKVCWVDYTYNAMGLRETRKNYNDFHDGWGPQLGGIYTYHYDENGKKTGWDLEFAGINYEKGECHYNEQGLLEAELIMNNPFTGIFENSYLTEYYYNDNGLLVQTIYYTWAAQVNDWTMQGVLFNEFDELGNCVVSTATTPSGEPQEKKVYKYDEKVLAENTFHYPNPEDDFPLLPIMNNMIESYEYYALDQTSGGLLYVCDYLFGYELIGELELSVVAEASADTIVLGETVSLTAKVSGGTGDYSFAWTPAEILDSASTQNPTATPTTLGDITFTVAVNDGENTVEATVSVYVKEGVSIAEQAENNVNIYPNPATEFIIIDSEEVEYVEVLDINGRVITSVAINGETRIEMKEYASGVYFVKSYINGTSSIQKVVKN